MSDPVTDISYIFGSSSELIAILGESGFGDFQPLDAELTAIAGLVSASDKAIIFTGSGSAATFTVTAYSRSLTANSLAADWRLGLGLAIGSDVQGWDSDLQDIADISPSNDDFIQRKAGSWVKRTVAQVVTDLRVVTDLVYQAVNTALTQIGALTPVNDDVLQRKAGVWTNRTMAQLAADLISPLTSAFQTLDSDLTTIAGLTATTDNFMQAKSSAWASRTPAQVAADLVTPLGGNWLPLAGGTLTGQLGVIAGDLTTGGILVGTNVNVAQGQTSAGAASQHLAVPALSAGDIHRYGNIASTNPLIQAHATSTAAGLAVVRWNATGANAAAIFVGHSKGATVGDFTALATGNLVGGYNFVGTDGTDLIPSARQRASVNGTVSAGVIPTRYFIETHDSAGTFVERIGLETDGTVTFGGNATATIASDQGIKPATKTIATLPTASTRKGFEYWVSDLGGGEGMVTSDGTGYRRLFPGYQAKSNTTNFTWTYLTDASLIELTGTITAARTVTVSTTNAVVGATVRFVHRGSGAFNWVINGINVALGQYIDLFYDGSAWKNAAQGTAP